MSCISDFTSGSVSCEKWVAIQNDDEYDCKGGRHQEQSNVPSQVGQPENAWMDSGHDLDLLGICHPLDEWKHQVDWDKEAHSNRQADGMDERVGIDQGVVD